MSQMTSDEIIADLMQKTESDSIDMMVARVLYDYYTVRDTQTRTYGVYVQVNENDYVTAVDSDAFITEMSLWLKVDEGRGELYKYAKVNYCPKGLYENGFYNYKLVGGVVVYSPQIEPPVDHNEVSPVEQFFVATRDYLKGEIVTVQGRLYEVTNPIAAGCSIIIGQNVEETTLQDYINSRTEG